MAEPYRIRRVDAAQVADLLPEAANTYLWSCVLQATEQGGGEAAGAALLARTETGTKVLLRAAQGSSREQVELALLAAALETAERRDAPALIAWQPEREGSAEAERWLERGFEAHNHRLIVEADARPAAENCKRQIARIRERGKIPADARVVPLRDAPMAQVGRLKVQAFGGKAQETIRRAQDDSPGALDPDLSWAVMTGDHVAGIALGSRSGADTMFGEAIAVDPAFRGRWALPMLKGAWLCGAVDRGLLRLRGEIAVSNAVSRKVFSRDGFEEVATLCDFARAIKISPATPTDPSRPTLVISSAPGLDMSPLSRKLRGLGFQDVPGSDDGLLTSLPARTDWWARTAGSFVRLPYVLLSGLPPAGDFRIVLVLATAAGHRKTLLRAAAQLRQRPGYRVLEIEEAVLVGTGAGAAQELGAFLAQ